METTTGTRTNLTYSEQAIINKEFDTARSRLTGPLAELRKLLAIIATLREYETRLLRDSAFSKQARRAYEERLLWIPLTVICLISLSFDSIFTFSSTAASLRDGLSHLFSFVSSRLNLYVSFFMALAVLLITICVTLATDSRKDREQLDSALADSQEASKLVAAIRRKKTLRFGWATMLTLMLATAAISELITLHIYEVMVVTAAAGNAANPIHVDSVTGTQMTFARMLQLVTPYAVTAVLHFLILYLPLPRCSPFPPHPCAPDQVSTKMKQVSRKIGLKSHRIFQIIVAVPNADAQNLLVGMLGERERDAINREVGREVINGSFTSRGAPLARIQTEN